MPDDSKTRKTVGPLTYQDAIAAAQESNTDLLKSYLDQAVFPMWAKSEDRLMEPDQVEVKKLYHSLWRDYYRRDLIDHAVTHNQPASIEVIIPGVSRDKPLSNEDRALCDYALKAACRAGAPDVVGHVLNQYDPSSHALKWAMMALSEPKKDAEAASSVTNIDFVIGRRAVDNPVFAAKLQKAKRRATALQAILQSDLDNPSDDGITFLNGIKDQDALTLIGRRAISTGQTAQMPLLINKLDKDRLHVWYEDAIDYNRPDVAATIYSEITCQISYIDEHPFPDYRIPYQVKGEILRDGLGKAAFSDGPETLQALVAVAEPDDIHEILDALVRDDYVRATGTVLDAIDAVVDRDHDKIAMLRDIRAESFALAVEREKHGIVGVYLEKNQPVSGDDLFQAGLFEDTRMIRRLAEVAGAQSALQEMLSLDAENKPVSPRFKRISASLAKEDHIEAAEILYNQAQQYAPASLDQRYCHGMLQYAAAANAADFCWKLLTQHPEIDQKSRVNALGHACVAGADAAFDVITPKIENRVQLMFLALNLAGRAEENPQRAVTKLLDASQCQDEMILTRVAIEANKLPEPPLYLPEILSRVEKNYPDMIDDLYADMLSRRKDDAKQNHEALYQQAGASAHVKTLFNYIDQGNDTTQYALFHRSVGGSAALWTSVADYAIRQGKSAGLPAILNKNLPQESLDRLLDTAVLMNDNKAAQALRHRGAGPEPLEGVTLPPSPPLNRVRHSQKAATPLRR